MEITINSKNFSSQKLIIKNNFGIIYGLNNSGKTLLLKEIQKGFKGNLKRNFLIDNTEISYGDYQTIFLKNDYHYDNELKITKTNFLRDELIKFINETLSTRNEYNDLSSKINQINLNISEVINLFFNQNADINEITKNYSFDVKLGLNSLETIIDKLLKIEISNFDGSNLSEDEISSFHAKMITLKILNLCIDWSDLSRKIVLIIDLPFTSADFLNKIKLKKYMDELINKNAIIIFSINDSNDLQDLNLSFNQINFISNWKINYIFNYESLIKQGFIINSYIESKYNNIYDYRSDIVKVIDEEDVEIEKKLFERHVMSIFLKLYFAENVVINESLNNEIFTTLNNGKINCTINIENKWICFLIVFLKQFSNISNHKFNCNNSKLLQIIDFWRES